MIFIPRNTDNQAFMLAWAARVLECEVEDFGDCHAIGFLSNRKLEAVAVYHNYRDGTIEISFAAQSPRWATRGNIKGLFAYPFIALGVRRLTAICKRKHKRVRRLMRGLGFLEEGILHDAFPDDDGAIYGMTRRFYERSKWNEEVAQAAAGA